MKILKYVGLSIVGCSLIAGIFAYYFWRGVTAPMSADGGAEVVEFEVVSGQGVKAIGRDLLAAGLIGSERDFAAYVWLKGEAAGLIAGRYTLSPAQSLREIVAVLTRGETESTERTLKIIEGWDTKDIAEYLDKQGLDGAGFLELARMPVSRWLSEYATGTADFQVLRSLPSGRTLEGFFFPDTYRVFADTDAYGIALKLLGHFEEKLTPELRQAITASGFGLHETITLASVIEKEVFKSGDRKLVADVFKKRLKVGMPLQADSTVNFVTGKKTPAISLNDRDIESPYNTYLNPGLPPGPICNPSLDAIKAAIYPESNDFWYFLSRLDNGDTVFSRTYEEHLTNKAKYLP